MTLSKRHQQILCLLEVGQEVLAADLAERFAVNIVTVRRDLAHLEQEGLLRRSRGGAVASQAGGVEFAFRRRCNTRLAQKRAIGRCAAASIQAGMAVSLDTGTTTLEVARHLVLTPRLRVLTNSLAIAAVLYPHDNIELVLLGGLARRGSPDLFGMLTEDNLRRFKVDVAILGADAVSPEGLYTTDAAVSRVSRALLEGAGRSILVADSSKFHARAFVQFSDWSGVSEVITDASADGPTRKWLAKTVGQVTYVPVQEPKARRAK